ncbi:DUF3732 domain-containing protein [Marinilabiliaceae bacterium JC017]|nr:DUF3732 domain-containing protein [Marinilabiliaceae bacterium JC017]
MSRWNIVNVIYYSKNYKRKILNFTPNDVTIITGASNTGKSAIISTIDYCLGSTDCNIASFVIERTTHVATKWTNGNTEFILAREISGSAKGSSKMYIDYGSNIQVPLYGSELKGKGTKDQIRAVVERLFGFNEVNDTELKINSNRITLRQLLPFMFLDKSVIDSNRIIFHGLDDSRKAKYIIESLPYFLGAVNHEEMEALRKLHRLKKGLEAEERKKRLFQNQEQIIVDKAKLLLREAAQFGIIQKQSYPNDKDELLKILQLLLDWKPTKIVLEDNELQDKLSKEKGKVISKINSLKRKRKALIHDKNKKDSFNLVLSSQKAKLDVQKFFNKNECKCPICSSQLTSSMEASNNITLAFNEITAETKMLEKHKPNIQKYLHGVELELDALKDKLTSISTYLEDLLLRSKEAKIIRDNNVSANRVIGRISYFLESIKEMQVFDYSKINQYLAETKDINERFGSSYRKERIEIAERTISTYATDNLKKLPRGIPCIESTINFFSEYPKVVLFNEKENKDYQFANIGSDENYLSIHLSLSFAMQKFFAKKNSPVPGVLLLDQVSRPYYSNDKESDELEIKGESDDEKALRKHFDFIFKQVEKNEGLQAIILEHAYLTNSEKYKKSTKYRWSRNCEEKLIPSDWPIN